MLHRTEKIICEGTVADNIKCLKKYTNNSLWGANTNCDFLFYGKITERDIEIIPTSSVRNSFKPCLVGFFSTDSQNKTILTVRIEAPLFIKVFFWYCLFHFILIECFFIFAKYVLMSGTITTKMFIIPILVMVVFSMCVLYSVTFGGKKAMDRLHMALYNTD